MSYQHIALQRDQAFAVPKQAGRLLLRAKPVAMPPGGLSIKTADGILMTKNKTPFMIAKP